MTKFTHTVEQPILLCKKISLYEKVLMQAQSSFLGKSNRQLQQRCTSGLVLPSRRPSLPNQCSTSMEDLRCEERLSEVGAGSADEMEEAV